MQLFACFIVTVLLASCPTKGNDIDKDDKKHHHHHHHHGQNKQLIVAERHGPAPPAGMQPTIVEKIKHLEAEVEHKEAAADKTTRGTIEVSSPLPPDFKDRFVQAAAKVADRSPAEITVISLKVSDQEGVMDVTYEAPASAVTTIQQEATDPNSQLAHSPLRSFLMARDDGDVLTVHLPPRAGAAHPPARSTQVTTEYTEEDNHRPTFHADIGGKSGDPSGIDIDTMMPYGELEPFGREDTAQELTEHSVKESDAMVDQLERAEVAEEKRSVFRALTRLRGAAITSFDGIARSQTGNIDEYNKVHQWRSSHPLHHLADEESDISKWAFPDNADF